ncbi:MAG: cytidine deaminase [Ferruginibacter sp.]
MKKKEINFSTEVYSSSDELALNDAALLKAARAVTVQAYAPYSNFLVGAVAQLANGKTISGTNQENAAYPVGICAERVLLSALASQYPGVAIETIAISYNNLNGKSARPISPCGICRQSLCEYEDRVKHPIRIILGGMEGEVYIVEKSSYLLPLSFNASDLD